MEHTNPLRLDHVVRMEVKEDSDTYDSMKEECSDIKSVASMSEEEAESDYFDSEEEELEQEDERSVVVQEDLAEEMEDLEREILQVEQAEAFNKEDM